MPYLREEDIYYALREIGGLVRTKGNYVPEWEAALQGNCPKIHGLFMGYIECALDAVEEQSGPQGEAWRNRERRGMIDALTVAFAPIFSRAGKGIFHFYPERIKFFREFFDSDHLVARDSLIEGMRCLYPGWDALFESVIERYELSSIARHMLFTIAAFLVDAGVEWEKTGLLPEETRSRPAEPPRRGNLRLVPNSGIVSGTDGEDGDPVYVAVARDRCETQRQAGRDPHDLTFPPGTRSAFSDKVVRARRKLAHAPRGVAPVTDIRPHLKKQYLPH